MNFWDFVDTPTGASLSRDRANDGTDFFAVLGRFGSSENAGINPLSGSASAPGYHPAFDRGATSGPNAWNLTQANGAIAGPDINRELAQFGHTCI